ncbi:hypothetical protein BP5796_04556 [Coleophoma crateriformis]|uniref:Ras-associating domain-containing protein n=1 Tax=Coleophoma crateriformis TaxID=565419 RepID=A0A3D8S9P5_9HELO|nr:hypothetical protein BP5796_04556 [Coleophoma crateriformis]
MAFCQLLSRCIDSSDKPLTARGFSMEYELLCNELALQWARLQVWQDAAGLTVTGSDGLRCSLLSRPGIGPTVTQTIQLMLSLITEIEFLRIKYQPKQAPKSSSAPTLDYYANAKFPTSTLLSHREFYESIKRTQKQTSFLAKTKWALRDQKRFRSKLVTLKSYIDGLESILGATYFQEQYSTPACYADAEHPPSYHAATSDHLFAASPPLSSPPHTLPKYILNPTVATRRYGCIFPQNFNLPDYCYARATPWPNTRQSLPLSSFNSSTSVEIFKSFRVSMHHTTADILPRCFLKYGIHTTLDEYALFIVCGEKERCLAMEERPLRIYKTLTKEGKSPVFMLRKISNLEEEAKRGFVTAQTMNSASCRGGEDN